jgi:DNA-binding MarR family transcriptional regulator
MNSTNHSSNLDLSQYRAIAEFRYQIRCFLRFSENAAVEAGLEPQQHQLLLAIKGMPNGREARIADLAARLQIQHHSTVELVSRSVTKGLLQKVAGETDRREVHVRLTPKGERVLHALTLHHRDELRRTAPALASALRGLTRESAVGRIRSETGKPRTQTRPRGTARASKRPNANGF